MRDAAKLEAEVQIVGRVQGVGFRPFIYRAATKNGLNGYVINLGDAGVEVIVEGTQEQIESFAREVREDAPPVSEIREVHIVYSTFRDRFRKFKIDRSENRGQTASGIFPPDIGICDECLKDIGNPASRWYDYPFTACASCGPRFTAIRSLPYDRERTHMEKFLMCRHCGAEYKDPMDRRFDAQGITCSLCGPKMNLYDASGSEIRVDDVFRSAAEFLTDGLIVAVKGIGGVHLAAIATDDDVVGELRKRKNRPFQPFGLMSPNLDAVRSFAHVDERETEVLTSWRKPIVLLRRKSSGPISELIAPGLDMIGVMLPYTGIHVALFKHLKAPALIMTSGNKPGLPMAIRNEDAFKDLRGIADHYLLHNRDIVARCDDSVLRIINGNETFIRRSRGYVPDPIEIPIKKGLSVALGAELRNSAAIANDGKCFMTQHLGDVTNLESLDFEMEALEHLKGLLNITRNPDVIGCDLHPGYMTSHLATRISQETDTDLVRSQHHHAHIVDVSAEHMITKDDPVIGVAIDGAGYGIDQAIWGGEVIISNYSGFDRVGHLEYLPMPGGDLCTLYPFRMLVAALTNVISDDEIRDITKNHITNGALPYGERELELIMKMSRDERTIKTSSGGRFLDAISALIGVCYRRTYEGEPAMRLEPLATLGMLNKLGIEPEIYRKEGIFILKTSDILYKMVEMSNKVNFRDIAVFGQEYLASGLAEIALRVGKEKGISMVALSGGVFVNDFITNRITKRLSGEGLTVLTHRFAPPGDGGTALGQSIIALSNVM